MPYANTYNGVVAAKVRRINQARVSTENVINDNVQPNDPVTSQVESMALTHPEVTGGNGYAAATLGDLGYEPTLGTTGATEGGKKPRKKKGEGLAGAGMGAGLAAAGMAAAGTSGGRKKCKKEGGALLTLQDIDKMHGQSPLDVNAKITVQAKPYNAEQMSSGETGAGREVGGGVSGGARTKRNDLVREIMKSKGLSLPEASKHIKANKLY